MAPEMVFCGTMLLVIPFCYLIDVSPFLLMQEASSRNPTPTGINAEELQPLALFMLVVLWFGLLLLQFSVRIPRRRGPYAWRIDIGDICWPLQD
ncbi:hypothetical protein Taro_028835 [Colocasia esculenta]|uniref:Uncharacterized protein n=1 Tax=Colocasia esculenta TaxID=4460 RepID=A0A843VT32_COLES|nr:hypothetical protein [Colocasia esculenta]